MTDKNNTTPTSMDIEQGLPKPSAPKRTASDKLKQLDKKAFLFAGFMFWAIILVAGGATAGVLLTQKNVVDSTNAPSEVVVDPSLTTTTTSPTEPPSAAPTKSPSEAPTTAPSAMFPLEIMHSSVVEKFNSKFEDCGTISNQMVCWDRRSDKFSIEARYTWDADLSGTCPESVHHASVTISEIKNAITLPGNPFEPDNTKDTTRISLAGACDCDTECFENSIDELLEGIKLPPH